MDLKLGIRKKMPTKNAYRKLTLGTDFLFKEFEAIRTSVDHKVILSHTSKTASSFADFKFTNVNVFFTYANRPTFAICGKVHH